MFTGMILFFTVLGIVPLFGYSLKTGKKRIQNGPDFNPPRFSSLLSLTSDGFIGLIIVALTLLPSGVIYVLMPILLDTVEFSNVLVSLALILFSLGGVVLSFVGLYIFPALLFAYIKLLTSEDLTIKDTVIYSLISLLTSKSYFKSTIILIGLSLLFGILTELFFISIILAPLAGIAAVFYFASLGYIIGSYNSIYSMNYDYEQYFNFNRQ